MIRDYAPDDEAQWLSTRLAAFFGTQYYDDVKTTKTPLAEGSIELVDVEGATMLGLLDVEVEAAAATIDTIAVAPGVMRAGIGRRLLAEAVRRLPDEVRTLDAWTREDAAASAWYQAMGFQERFRYLHVYRSDEADDPSDGFTAPEGLSAPVIAMMHAPIEREAEMRSTYARVYVCRQYVAELDAWRG